MTIMCYQRGESPLYKAVKYGNEIIVKLLLDAGADVNLTSTNVSLSSNVSNRMLVNATFIDYSML